MSDTNYAAQAQPTAAWAPAPPQAPLNDRLGSALSRLEVLVNNTQSVLNKLRMSGPETPGLSEPSKSPCQSHEIMDQLELQLERTSCNVDRINGLI